MIEGANMHDSHLLHDDVEYRCFVTHPQLGGKYAVDSGTLLYGVSDVDLAKLLKETEVSQLQVLTTSLQEDSTHTR